MKRTLTIIAIAVLFILVCVEAVFLMNNGDDNKKPADPLRALWSGNYLKEQDYWKGQINKVGTEKAYELFKKDTEGKEFGVSHALAHIFGELIYEKEGISGIVYCDAAFAYGCYHSFFGAAITEHGVDVVPKLDALCVERWGPLGLGCPHGIGHGILGYVGDDKLNEALDICADLSWKGRFGGCQSGVFMEYNFHTMQSLKGVENRAFNPDNPTYPCEAVPSAFRQSCYFELAAWLSNTFGRDYERAGTICSEVKGGDSREACFMGIGNTIGPDSRYNSEESISSCNLMPDKDSIMLCRAGAAWAFYAEPTTRDRYPLLCKGLSTTEEQTCISKSKII